MPSINLSKSQDTLWFLILTREDRGQRFSILEGERMPNLKMEMKLPNFNVLLCCWQLMLFTVAVFFFSPL